MSVVFPFKSGRFNKIQKPAIVKPTVPTVPTITPVREVVKPVPPIVKTEPTINPISNNEIIETSGESSFIYKKSNLSHFAPVSTTMYKVKI
jgi:hypothetical protein